MHSFTNGSDRPYIAAISALPDPLNFDSANNFVRAWAPKYPPLRMILEFASESGKSKAYYLGDLDWFRLLGQYWASFANVEQHLDALLDSPFYDIADRRYYDHVLGLSKRELRMREKWRKACIAAMMTADEMAAYTALPDEIELYRGCNQDARMGLTWAMDRSVAERSGGGVVLTATARKRDVVAVKSGAVICWNPKVITETILGAAA